MATQPAKCASCSKTVYPNESIRACNNTFHKGCLKCLECGITLNLKTVVSHQNKPYCGTHKPNVAHTQVASVTDQSAMRAPRAAARVQGISKDARMTFAPGATGPVRGSPNNRGAPVNRGSPASQPASGNVAPRSAPSASYSAPPSSGGASGYRGPNTVKVGGGSNKCPSCAKTVYENEQIKACSGVWHKGCLKCTECGLSLNLKNLESFQNKPYCKVHRPTVSHHQVASLEMQTALKAPKAARMQKGVDQTARSTFAPGALKPVHATEVVNAGGASASDIQSKHAPKQSFVAPEPTPHITYEQRDSNLTGAADKFSKMSLNDQQSYGGDQTYDQGGYDQGGYDDQQSYDQGGYDDQQSYDQGGYDDQQSYDQGGYDDQQGGYDDQQGGYDDQQGGYDQGGYDDQQGGYDDQGGYDEQGGYEEGGYDEGYYEEGGYDEGYGEEEYY